MRENISEAGFFYALMCKKDAAAKAYPDSRARFAQNT